MPQQTLRGVNLAGWLTLESWVTPELFAGTGVKNAFALATKLGEKDYAKVSSTHRETFIRESDFEAISERGYNAVRLEVPWYVMGESGPLPGAHDGCLEFVDAAFEWAERYKLKVLLDLCLAPGATTTSDGFQQRCDFTPARRLALLEVVANLSARYANNLQFWGIEPLDEMVVQRRRGISHGFALSDGMPLHTLRNLYRDAYDVVRDVAGTRPVVVFSDGGMPKSWKHFMASDRYQNVMLDHHFCRVGSTHAQVGPAGAKHLVDQCRRELTQAQSSGLPTIVGEWSAALPGSTSALTSEGRLAQQRMFVAGQLALLDQVPVWFFHTWKTSANLADFDARLALSSFERDMLRL